MKKAVVGSLAAIASLGLAQLGPAQRADAADLSARPLLSADSTWTGLYGGINVGGLSASGDAQWTPLPSPAQSGFNATTSDIRASGLVAGFQAGFNYQIAPAWVAGIEADFTGSHATSSALSPWTAFGTNVPLAGAFTKEIRTLEWLTTARGRIGYLGTLTHDTGHYHLLDFQ
jgi:outer membrane immunogenic protein